MQVQGRIKLIGLTQDVSSSFRKRELVVTTEDQYPQHIMIEFNQDKCDLLNMYQVGQQVVVDINLRGREWQSPQGEIRYFNTIQGWKINALQQQQQPTQYAQNNAQVGGFQQQQTQNFNQNNGFNKNQQQQLQQQGYVNNNQIGSNYIEENTDDLPF